MTSCGKTFLGIVLSGLALHPLFASPEIEARRVYSHLLDPREHPDYERRAVKPPSWQTFKNRTQFTCLRGFNVQENRINGFAEEIQKFTRTYELGDVIWPSYPILFATNLADLADEIKRRELYLFDVWGYVPGSGPGGYWQQFAPPAEAFTLLEAVLGERWLGTDIGEQDGRYIGGYANQMAPASAGRFQQYLNFQRHFERMGDDLGHKHATLVSLNFGHYLIKEGTYTLIGAETAQALPNNQVYYAFIRGAGKQYGVPWFGNASIYNRWGYKSYGASGRSDGYAFGPNKGSSLSLLKRLLYSHILYNSVAVGFENGWFEGEDLSPIGRMQQSAQRWIKEHGQPGVMHTPIALLVDFYSGWSFPRHLYSGDVYRVWGNLPYQPGDYLTDGLLDLIYPGYQDSSYFHDERGFVAPTPYGDVADCLLSDAPGWLLDRYGVVVVAGALSGGREIRDKLESYAERGGHLLITAGNLTRLPGGLAGVSNVTAVLQVKCGRGQVTFFDSPFGVVTNAVALTGIQSETDKPLPKPYVLEAKFREAVDQAFRGQRLFNVKGEGLSFIACRKSPGHFTVGIANTTWREQAFRLESLGGGIRTVRELPLDQSERGTPGHTPEGVETSSLGRSSEGSIAGGDMRIFAVETEEHGVEDLPHLPPPPRPLGRVLPLRSLVPVQEEILARPTFFEHFDGVCVSGRYLEQREKAALRHESRWLKRQGVRLFVDLSPQINLYPGLRLMDNLHDDFESSMAAMRDVLDKMQVFGSRDLIVSLHRFPENNFTETQSRTALVETLKTLTGHARNCDVTVHLRLAFGKPPWSLDEALDWLDSVKAPNLKVAPSTALLSGKSLTEGLRARLKPVLGLWLVAAPQRDLAGKLWDAHGPLHEAADGETLLEPLRVSPEIPLLLDAWLPCADAEYLESKAVQGSTNSFLSSRGR